MDETNIISCILKGCCLARELHSSLPAAAEQPRLLSSSCEEIASIFRAAKERLDAALQAAAGGNCGDHQLMFPSPNNMYAQGSSLVETGAGSSHVEAQDWLRTTYLQQLQAQFGGGGGGMPEDNRVDHGIQPHADREAAGSGGEFQDSRNANPQRSRRRKDDRKKRTETVAAPRIGNTDVPPDDNFTWRKYGQKEILGSMYPRSYYRCTHQKLYNCPAKKQVQRLDHDPSMFDITYFDEHTCHKSAMAQASVPPPPSSLEMMQATASQLPMGGWLSIELKPTGEGAGAFMDPSQVPMKMELGLAGEEGGGGSAAGSGAGAGPSMVRFGHEVPDYPVVDLADTMFNSGSSSSNSMDFLFTSDHKWEQNQPHGDKKN